MAQEDIFVSDPEKFREECRQREHRTTIAHFGVDLIIDRQGGIHCLELNGQNSGTKGFSEAYEEDFARKKTIEFLASFGLPVNIYTCAGNEKKDCLAEETSNVNTYDLEKIHLECSKVAMSGMLPFIDGGAISDDDYYKFRKHLSSDRLDSLNRFYSIVIEEELGLQQDDNAPVKGLYSSSQAEGIVWANITVKPDLLFDENRFLVVNPYLVESVTQNKVVSELLMFPYGSSSFSLQTEEAHPDNQELRKYLNRVKTSKVVFKPVNGQCGDGVVVLDKKHLLNTEGKLKKEINAYFTEPENNFDEEKAIENIKILSAGRFMLQPFIESKPFYSPKTGKNHRGSIRYIANVFSNQGKIYVHHAGGYVRLAPEPVGNSLDSQVANLARGAEAVSLSKRDQSRLKTWVDLVLPHFYRGALRLGEHSSSHLFNSILMNNAFREKTYHFDYFYKSPWIW